MALKIMYHQKLVTCGIKLGQWFTTD